MRGNALLDILSAFVNEREPQFYGTPDFSDVLEKAYIQNILPIVAYMNRKYHFLPDTETQARLTELLYQTVFVSANRFHAFESLSKTLSENGIEHMPVKGWYLKELYPVPEIRTFGDIDILIHPNDRKKCDLLMHQWGYTVKNDWEPTFSYLKDTEFYEFHSDLVDTKIPCAPKLGEYFSNAWQYSEVDGEKRRKLSADYHFIYVIAHMAKHLYSSGAGIRMYLDVAMFLTKEREALNLKFIEEELTRLGLGRFYMTVISCVKDWFDTEINCETAYVSSEITDRLLKYTLDSDIFGKTRDHSVITLRNSEKPKASAIRQALFPNAEELEKRYTFVKGKKWLLPAAWAVRAVKNSSRIGSKMSDIKELSSADYNDVADYDSFMKSLGL